MNLILLTHFFGRYIYEWRQCITDNYACFLIFQVRDGSTSSSPLLGTFCGASIPPRVQSTQRSMYVHFKTDSSVSNHGFEAAYGSALEGERSATNSVSLLTLLAKIYSRLWLWQHLYIYVKTDPFKKLKACVRMTNLAHVHFFQRLWHYKTWLVSCNYCPAATLFMTSQEQHQHSDIRLCAVVHTLYHFSCLGGGGTSSEKWSGGVCGSLCSR